MDRDRYARHSSLPSSLIPHLYSAPRDSGTRTTLHNHHHPPPFPFPPPPPQLLVPTSDYPVRLNPYSYPPPPPPPPPAPDPPADPPDLFSQSIFYRRPLSPPIPDSTYNSNNNNPTIDDEVDSQNGKSQRAHSLDTDDNPAKSRNPRKTAVACNFCRGRKLRCNGAKPSCYNCTVRKFECEYVPIQRRRGPGKAPRGRGSRARKPGPSRSVPPPSSPEIPLQEYELDALAPELRPYTSVLSLDNFDFQPPPDPTPQYLPTTATSTDSRDLYYYSRTSSRPPRIRKTSSDDRLNAEGHSYRKLG